MSTMLFQNQEAQPAPPLGAEPHPQVEQAPPPQVEPQQEAHEAAPGNAADESNSNSSNTQFTSRTEVRRAIQALLTRLLRQSLINIYRPHPGQAPAPAPDFVVPAAVGNNDNNGNGNNPNPARRPRRESSANRSLILRQSYLFDDILYKRASTLLEYFSRSTLEERVYVVGRAVGRAWNARMIRQQQLLSRPSIPARPQHLHPNEHVQAMQQQLHERDQAFLAQHVPLHERPIIHRHSARERNANRLRQELEARWRREEEERRAARGRKSETDRENENHVQGDQDTQFHQEVMERRRFLRS